MVKVFIGLIVSILFFSGISFAGDVIVQEGDIDANGTGYFKEIDVEKIVLDEGALTLERVSNYYKVSRSDANTIDLRVNLPFRIYNTLSHASANLQFAITSAQGDCNIEAVSGRHLNLVNYGTGNLYLSVASSNLIMSLDDMVASTRLRVGDTAAPGNELEVKGKTQLGDGGTTNYTEINSSGTLSFNGSAEFHPPRISQNDQPSLNDGEMVIWHDADAANVYILYDDPDEGSVKIQLQ